MRRKADPTPPLQQADFNALPAAIQRKYFSSLERLQIQQQAREREEPTSGRSSRASSSTQFRPGSRHRAHKSELNTHPLNFSQSEVDFFLSLPPKIQKQHFSREEQEQLLAKCEHAQQRFNDFRFDFQKATGCTADRKRSRTKSPIKSSPPPLSARRRRPSLHLLPVTRDRAVDRESSIFYLDLMSPRLASTNAQSAPRLRRTMSLSSQSYRHSTSTSLLTGEVSLFTVVSGPRHQRTRSASVAGRGSSQPPVAPLFDSEATHYQDPEARKKLRTYLACPQKFDEAVEFGFPSTADKDTTTPHYQLPPIPTHSRKFSHVMQSFLRGDGTLSFIEDNASENQGLEYDADSITDVESPTTPSSADPHFLLHSRQTSQPKFSLDSTGHSSLNSTSGYVNREMTLRMTLTRPDLRADEDQLYGWQASGPKPPKEDPFALEDLMVTDDATGAKGAFYVKPRPRGNIVARLFKRASSRD